MGKEAQELVTRDGLSDAGVAGVEELLGGEVLQADFDFVKLNTIKILKNPFHFLLQLPL